MCTMTESLTTSLHWSIDFSSGKNLHRVTFLPGDPTGQHLLAINSGTGIVYHFNLTSRSPPTSIMTTNTPTDLFGTIVSCSDAVEHPAGCSYTGLEW